MITASTLKDTAIELHEERVAEAFMDFLAEAGFAKGSDTVMFTVEGSVVVADNGLKMRFCKKLVERNHWQLAGVCPNCGEETWSSTFDELTELGQLLSDFAVSLDHSPKCTPVDLVAKQDNWPTLD